MEIIKKIDIQIEHAKDCQNVDGTLPGFINGLECAKRLAQTTQRKPSINQLVEDVHKNAVTHGWWEQEREFGTLLMLIVTEVSEALEEFRMGHGINETWYSTDKQGNKKMEGVPSELADVIIRIFDLCCRYGIDIEAAIKEKMIYNSTRPFKHGGKRC